MKKKLLLFPLLLLSFVLLLSVAVGAAEDDSTALRVTPGRTVSVTLPADVGNYTYNEEIAILKGFSTDENGVTTLLFACRADIPAGTYDLLYIDGESSMGLSVYGMGDVNMDGDVSVRDAVLIKQAIVEMVELSGTQHVFANVYDADDEVNTRDAVLVLQHIVGMDVTLGTPDGDSAVCSGASLSIIDGYLYATYLDAPDTPVNLGRVKGEDGLSAFEIFKKYHPEYEGTEADWIESLKGDTGVSVTDAFVDEEYHLWLVLSNGTRIDAGFVGVTLPEEEGVTISFNTNGGSAVPAIRAEAGTPVSAPTAPERTGYIFDGWYIDSHCTRAYTFGVMPPSDISLFAKWKLAWYEIRYHANGAEWYYGNGTYTILDGDRSLYPDPIKYGYHFDGWYSDPAFVNRVTVIESGTTGDVDLYAKFTPYRYTITFETNGGSAIAPITQDYGTPLTPPADPTNGGMPFLGWYTDAECTQPYTFPETMPLGDLTLYTKWQTKFTVMFNYIDLDGDPMPDMDGYTRKQVKNIQFGKDVRDSVLGDVQRFDDYVIIGWNADLAQATAGVIDPDCTKNIRSDKTLYSVVRAKETFTVTFKKADNSDFQTLQLKEGSVIDDSIPRPVQMGTYFKAWALYSEDSESSLACIRDDCEFIAVVGRTDGVIGKVAAGSITVDGIKEDAYMTSGAYLPVNTTLQADRGTTRAEATVDADTWLVWDGDFIYMLMEVSDKSLVGRADAYVKGGIDAYLNDAVEIWYSFEQDGTLTNNETRVGLDAMGTAKYALPRSSFKGVITGIGGGRSTHYEDIQYAVRNYLLGATGSDLSRTGYVGNVAWDGTGAEPEYQASYIIEFAFPAWTEGAADTTKGADPKTGLLPGRSVESNNIEDYAFTSGDKLVAGDFVRFNLGINDLMISQREMTGAPGTYFWDCPPEGIAYGWPGAEWARHNSMLYATDGAGNIVGMANTTGLFSASGNTQRELQYYVMFSLSDTSEAQTKVWSMGKKTVDDRAVPTMLKSDGTEYVRD